MYKLSARQLHTKFKNKELSATEITSYFLKRSEDKGEELGAYITILKDRALAQAKALDEKLAEGKPVGKLAGVVIAMKDNMHIKGEKTTCASNFLTNYTAPFNCTVTDLIESQDGIIIAKTNLDEFAMGSSNENSAFFPAKNPWDTSLVPGGSSGGSAASVSARLSPLGLGSDTGGSIRQPASFTGTVGYKPTFGRVSRYGLVAFGSSFDQIGPFANSVEDIAMIMEVLGHYCPHDSTSIKSPPEPFLDLIEDSIQGKTIGVPFDNLVDLTPAIQKHVDQTIEHFKSLGAKIVPITLKYLKYSVPMYYILAVAEASTNLARYDGVGFSKRSEKSKTLDDLYNYSKEEGFGKEVKQRILLGTYVLSAGFQDAYYKKAQKVRTLMIQEFEEIFQSVDVIMTPTSPNSAFKINSIQDPLTMYLQDLYTICANLAGLPAISLPSGLNQDGRPIGMQIMGPQMEDARVMRFANALEKSINFTNIPPAYDKEF